MSCQISKYSQAYIQNWGKPQGLIHDSLEEEEEFDAFV